MLLILTSIPPVFLARRSLADIPGPNLLDDSWVLDTAFKAAHHVWLGRDVTFTYGPLFQWMESAPSRWVGVSMGAVYATAYCFLLWGSIVCCFFSVRMLLPEQPAWKRSVLLLLLFLFWYPSDLRPCLVVLTFAAFLRLWQRVAASTASPLLVAPIAALVCGSGFLFSADVGVYAAAAIALSGLGAAIEFRHNRAALRSLAVAFPFLTAASIAVALLVNAALAQPLDFRFWKNSWAVVSGYRWILPAMMSRSGKYHILLVLVAGTVMFAALAATRSSTSRSIASRSSFLLSGFLFATLMLQSCLVRSDDGHIAMASFPFVLFCGVILFNMRNRLTTVLGILLAFAASVSLGQYSGVFRPSAVMSRIAAVQHPTTTCPPKSTEFDRACLPHLTTTLLENVKQFAQQYASPREAILVFPYQTIVGIASQRTVAGGLMQTYLAVGKDLSALDIAGMERFQPTAGIYFPDGPLSPPIDGVSNFTRSPEVWFWIARHYSAAQELSPGVVALVRDSRANAISLQSHALGLLPQELSIRKRAVLLDLGDVIWPADADFLRLRIKINYPFWWKLRKPQRLQLEITRADGNRELKSFLAEPNRWDEVWFYPWQETDLVQFFRPDESGWRSSARPAITHLRLWVTPFDWISVVPASVSIASADGVELVHANP